MAEVISMEDFKKSAGEVCEDCGGPLSEHPDDDDIQESWDWAQEKSRQLVAEAGGSLPVLMLIRNLVDDTMQAVDQLCNEKMPTGQFYEAVTDGVAMFREVSE
jgi:hypothetical protein